MGKLLLLVLLCVGAVVGYNYHAGRDLFQLPGTSSRTLDAIRDKATEAVRDTVHTAVGDPRAGDGAAGVHSAVNRAEEAVGAAAVTSKIKAKMALDDLVKAGDIGVETEGGVVTLTGRVGSKDEQRRAVRIATETAGVTKVVNHLLVR